MKKILLSMATFAIFSTANAQQLFITSMPQARETTDAKFLVSPSYGILLHSDGVSSVIGFTLAGDVSKDLRLSVMSNFSLDDNRCFGIAAMLGTQKLYSNPYTHSFQEISFGIGYQSFTTNYYYYDEDYNRTKDGVFFPIRYKWGYSLTKNLDFGLDMMFALTTISGHPVMLQTGLFFALKF